MPRKRTREVIERGTIAFYVRPRVQLVLVDETSGHRRVLTIGRKQLPRSRQRERFLAFVTRPDDPSPDDPAAGRGTYTIVKHDGHTHLEYELESAEEGIERRASYILTVANPDPAAWGLGPIDAFQLDLFPLDDEPLTIGTPFPAALQSRFGDRRFIDAGPEFLDHEGAELVLIGARK